MSFLSPPNSSSPSFGGDRLIIASSSNPAIRKLDGYKLSVDKAGKRPILVVANENLGPKKDPRKFIDISNLKWCAKDYDLSTDPKSYVFTEIAANNVGLPNRNMDTFPMKSTLEWRPKLGRVAFATYRWKCANQNHQNQEPLKAKGVIFDSYMDKIKGKWHVKILVGWCRDKDGALANRIANNKDAGYSMACFVEEAECSVCGFKSNGGNVTCEHVRGGSGKGRLWDTGQGSPILVHEFCNKLNYWEISHVEDRADFDCSKNWVG